MQNFASEWLEESRAIEESLRFREEEVPHKRIHLSLPMINLNILTGALIFFFLCDQEQRRHFASQGNDNNNLYDDSRSIIAEQNAAYEESLKQDREKVKFLLT